MNILNKIDQITKINESGIRNIRKLAKQFPKGEIYMHMDTDGIASAIAMKYYLQNQGVKIINAFPIQYGDKEYSIDKGQKGVMKILVDFAHGKPMFHIHTDHHDSQIGISKSTSTKFIHAPSNTGDISGNISPRELFPPKDLKIINTVDSADFASQGLEPDDIMNAAFKLNKNISVEKNHRMMGLVVNKLLLTYKNKPSFLSDLVMKSKPSLLSMYNVIIKLAKQEGYKPIDIIKTDTENYVNKQKTNIIPNGKLSDIKTLKSGQSIEINGIIAQYGAGYMGKGNQYDRYVPFKLHPDANYYSILWAVGILQVSENPFKKLATDFDLGKIAMNNVMPKFKSKLESIKVTLDYLKFSMERDVMKKNLKNTVGFTFEDFMALYSGKIKNLPDSGSYQKLIADITNKPYKYLSNKQKAILKKVTVNGWDIIMAGSGGHKAITNLSGFSYLGKGYVDIMRDIQYEFIKVLVNKTKEV